MTRDEFISNAVALVGSDEGWQARIAELLDINERAIRRAVQHGPGAGIVRATRHAMGENSNAIRHAEWICGDGNDGREYLIHTSSPRFRCLIVGPDDDYDIEADPTGVYRSGETWLAGWVWIDPPPDNMAQWKDRAADALEQF